MINLIGFPDGTVVKNLPTNTEDARDMSLIPGSGRSPGKGNGNPLQYSCLENPMDGVAWSATVHRVANSRTQLIDFTSLHRCSIKEVVNNMQIVLCK